MPRVYHVKKARKDNPVCKKGESYYWWKFRFGGKRYSLTPPKPSQLTQSEFLGTLYDIEDSFNTAEDLDGLKSIQEEVEMLRDETEEKLENMPDSLQYSPTGELLQERIDFCDELISEFDNIEEDESLDEIKERFDFCVP